MQRCQWSLTSSLERDYHDLEWGVPVHNDRVLFEFLLLEGAQAGLSWLTILKKRDAYRLAFDQFNPENVARYQDAKINALLSNPGIVRNRLKINAAVLNAQVVLNIQQEFGQFDDYLWRFVDGKPQQNQWRTHHNVPQTTPQSDALSKDLKARGCQFVGSTICYAFMQAIGMVNDHTIDCFRHSQLQNLS